MSDADKPWSAPPAGSSFGSDTASLSPSKTAPIENARITGHEDLRASLVQAADEFRRKQSERQAESGQSTGQAVLPSVANVSQSASLQDSGPTAPDMSDMAKHFDAVFAKREEERNELARRKGEGEFLEGAGRIMRGAMDRDEGAAKMAAGIDNAENAAFASGAHAHHGDEMRGWAEAARTASAGAHQHETEEHRGRSSGMSL